MLELSTPRCLEFRMLDLKDFLQQKHEFIIEKSL